MTSAFLSVKVFTELVPTLPGCVTYGKTVEGAIEMDRDAITGYVESLIEDGEAVPIEDDLRRSYSGDVRQSQDAVAYQGGTILYTLPVLPVGPTSRLAIIYSS